MAPVRARDGRRRCRGFSTIDVLAGSGLTIMTMGTIFSFSQAQLKALADGLQEEALDHFKKAKAAWPTDAK